MIAQLRHEETLVGWPGFRRETVDAAGGRLYARVFAVLDAPVPVADPALPVELPREANHVVVTGLRCRYGDGPWALDGVDLDIPPGKRIGVVGASGAGKSTLAAVLLAFLPYEEGSVTLGGVELADLRGEDVRSVVGLTTQDPHIFDTTLRENLLLARRDASEADLRDALDRARLAAWTAELPEGLDTAVGGYAARMSGGQQQRLGIARTELAGFPVVVLDEPAEHLDSKTADELVADLLRATVGRSTVMITHRLAGLDAMDEILLLEQGRVVERGTHAELVAAEGIYSRRWSLERQSDTQRGNQA